MFFTFWSHGECNVFHSGVVVGVGSRLSKLFYHWRKPRPAVSHFCLGVGQGPKGGYQTVFPQDSNCIREPRKEGHTNKRRTRIDKKQGDYEKKKNDNWEQEERIRSEQPPPPQGLTHTQRHEGDLISSGAWGPLAACDRQHLGFRGRNSHYRRFLGVRKSFLNLKPPSSPSATTVWPPELRNSLRIPWE